MKISTNARTGKKVQLTSWKSPSDPSIGSFSAGIHPVLPPEIFIGKDGSPYWRSGPWNGRIFVGVQNAINYVFNYGFSLVDDEEGTFYLTFTYSNLSLFKNFVLNVQGNINQTYWYEGK